jgi:hypothetical protein
MKLPHPLLLTSALISGSQKSASAFTLPKFVASSATKSSVDPSAVGLATRLETGGSLVDYMNGPVFASLSSSALADPPVSTSGVSLLQEDVSPPPPPPSMTATLARNKNDNATELKVNSSEKLEAVPTTMRAAVRRFFFGKEIGPILVVGSIASFLQTRFALATTLAPLSTTDLALFATSIVFWWFQEHVLHQKALHSNFDWLGKRIHEAHHDRQYHHVSIDSAELIMGWLLTVHVFLRAVLPLHLALSATIGYATAGLFYEWAHYIVHTKVKPKRGSFWARVRDNHIRHHQVNEKYWLAFSVPAIDDLFGTNPGVKEARQEKAGG